MTTAVTETSASTAAMKISDAKAATSADICGWLRRTNYSLYRICYAIWQWSDTKLMFRASQAGNTTLAIFDNFLFTKKGIIILKTLLILLLVCTTLLPLPKGVILTETPCNVIIKFDESFAIPQEYHATRNPICTVWICITLSVDSALAVAWTIPDHETASIGSVNVDATMDITKRAIILKVHSGSDKGTSLPNRCSNLAVTIR